MTRAFASRLLGALASLVLAFSLPLPGPAVAGSPAARMVLATPPTAPDFTRSFDQVTRGYKSSRLFSFGTGPHPGGAVAIENVTQLADWFNAYSANAGLTVINKEMQRYMPFSSSENFVFDAQGLALTGTIQATTGSLAVKTATVSGAVSYSRTVNVTDASALRFGQVVGLNAKASANLHATWSNAVRGTFVTGDTATVTITSVGDELFAPIAISTTVIDGDSFTAIAQRLVDGINADATLAANNVKAYKHPLDPGAYAVTIPRRNVAGSPAVGRRANGSIRAITVAVGKTGTITHGQSQATTALSILSLSGNTLTLSHPVTLADGDTLTISPTLMLMRTNTYTSSSATHPVGDTTGIEVNQLVQTSFQDTNLRRVISKTSTDITLEASVGAIDGVYITVLPAYGLLTSAASTAINELYFTSIPTGVEVGNQVLAYDLAGPASNLRVTAIDRVSSPNKLTLSSNVTVGSGGRIYLWPAIQSAQIWSKFNIQPEGTHPRVAMEATIEAPAAVDAGAWPAWWLYTDTDDPNPGGTVQSNSEIDGYEGYAYWNNSNTGGYRAAVATGSPVDIYNHPEMNAGNMPGNNMSYQVRKLQMVWTADQVYFYLDGTLIRSQAFTWNSYKRAQIAANLALGSVSTSFNANGLFPIDFSRFPMKYRIKTLKVMTAPGR